MNYCIVAFGVMLLIAGTTWIFDGRKHYEGPHLDIQALIDGQVEGMETVRTTESANKTQEEMVEGRQSVPIDA